MLMAVDVSVCAPADRAIVAAPTSKKCEAARRPSAGPNGAQGCGTKGASPTGKTVLSPDTNHNNFESSCARAK